MVSNKTLSIILISTMLVAIFGVTMALNRIQGVSDFYALTGAWDGPGINSTYASVNLTITSQLKINFTIDKADFGSGYIKAGQTGCTLSTGVSSEDTTGCTGFNAPNAVSGFLLENIGNEYAKLNLSNMNYSASLIGGSNPGYSWTWTAEDTDTCDTTGKNADIPAEGTYVNLTSTNYLGSTGYPQPGKQLCGVFNYSISSNGINITFKITIPSGATARTVSDTWFAFATAV
jgi:hypothetical protein